MALNRCEFEILTFLEREGSGTYSVRTLSDALSISGTAVMRSLEALMVNRLIDTDGLPEECSTECEKLSGGTAPKGSSWGTQSIHISGKGLEALEPYRVKRAIIAGAGFGSRMMPATADRPKPMVTVNGIRIIDTLLDAMIRVGIEEIILVGGYKIEKMKELLDKYPFLRILVNTKYSEENNISSALLAKDYFEGGCYFCEADLYISNPDVIRKYQYATNILGSWALETDDWCFQLKDGYLTDYKKGGTRCYNYYGISYWTDEDSRRLRDDWVELHDGPDGKDLFWEFPALIQRADKYKIELRLCRKQDIIEIDNYYELAQLDPSYR